MPQSFYRLNLGITKCYLLPCSGGYLLVDTAYPKDYGKFVKAMDRLGISLSEIKYLLLTHHHDDHVGFAAQLVAQTGCKVIAHQNALPPLSRGESEDTMEPVNWCIKAVFSLFEIFHKEFTYPPLAVTGDDMVISGDDTDLLESIGIDGRIFYTPGHSSDSISVVLSDGSAFVGDVAMNFLNFCGIKHRPIYIESIDQVFESWQRLVEHGAVQIYPAHGEPFPAEKLTQYRKKFTRE